MDNALHESGSNYFWYCWRQDSRKMTAMTTSFHNEILSMLVTTSEIIKTYLADGEWIYDWISLTLCQYKRDKRGRVFIIDKLFPTRWPTCGLQHGCRNGKMAAADRQVSQPVSYRSIDSSRVCTACDDIRVCRHETINGTYCLQREILQIVGKGITVRFKQYSCVNTILIAKRMGRKLKCNEWKTRWVSERMNVKRMNEWTNERMNERMNGWMNEK